MEPERQLGQPNGLAVRAQRVLGGFDLLDPKDRGRARGDGEAVIVEMAPLVFVQDGVPAQLGVDPLVQIREKVARPKREVDLAKARLADREAPVVLVKLGVEFDLVGSVGVPLVLDVLVARFVQKAGAFSPPDAREVERPRALVLGRAADHALAVGRAEQLLVCGRVQRPHPNRRRVAKQAHEAGARPLGRLGGLGQVGEAALQLRQRTDPSGAIERAGEVAHDGLGHLEDRDHLVDRALFGRGV